METVFVIVLSFFTATESGGRIDIKQLPPTFDTFASCAYNLSELANGEHGHRVFAGWCFTPEMAEQFLAGARGQAL